MGKQEICIDISGDPATNNSGRHRSKLSLYKNLNTSKTSIENELIYSKKITDIPSRYKTEETNFASFKHDIVCYNLETPDDKHDQTTENAINNRKTTRKPKKASKRVKQSENKNSDNLISDPHDHYFLTDYPDQIHKESIHAVESNISKEPLKWKTSRTRLLHSMLRPDTSKTSNLVLPDVNYTLSTEKLRKPKYPKNVPPPVFKQVGSYKGKIPVMTSKERLRQRTKLRKEQQQFEKLKKTESKELQQLKYLKRKENTQYDILFGKHNPEEVIEENDDDESVESQHKKKSATRNLLKRFRKRPKSESEIEITMIEEPRPITKSSSVNLFIDDDDDDEDSEIEEPKEESEDEPEEESEDEPAEESEDEFNQEAEQTPEQALKEEPAQEDEELLKQETKLEPQPKQEVEQEVESGEVELKEEVDEEELEGKEYEEELLIEDYFEEEPNKENLVEITPKEESPITAIEATEIPIEIIPKEREHTGKPKSTAEKSPCEDECTEPCGYKPISKKRLVIFKGCDNQLCTYDEGKECNKLMINIRNSSRGKPKSVEIIHSNRKAFPTESRSSRRCSNDNNLIEIKTVPAGNLRNRSFQLNFKNSTGNRSETVEKELQTTSRNSTRNGSKSGQRNRVTRNIKKSTYDSKEVLYEKELQSYDYVTDSVLQNHQNLKATDHNLLLDLNFQNKVTQTYHSRKKEKNIQTPNYFPSNEIERHKTSINYSSYSKNAFQVSSGKNLKIIRKTPLGKPQLLIINHPIRYQSQMPKPTIDIIYKNSKYLYPKYVKTIIPHENSHKISVNSRKNSYDNNFQYNLPNNKNYKVFTYFVNVQQEPNDDLQHSRNLKTIDRDLIIKFV